MSYVEAELDRRHPMRRLLRSTDPADLREAERQVRAGWAATVARLRGTAQGLASDFVPDQEEQGLDRAAAPDLDQVMTVRDEQAAELERWLESVTAGELSTVAPVPAGAGWPPYAAGKTVLECLHVVLNEEWEHHGFCVRDLDLLEG